MSQGREVGVRSAASTVSAPQAESESKSSTATASATGFTSEGPFPPVSNHEPEAGARRPTASELAYGPHPEYLASDPVAENVLEAAADVVQNEHGRMIGQVPVLYQLSLWMLLAAAIGESNGKPLSGRDRLAMLDGAMDGLRPAIDAYGRDQEGKEWLDSNLLTYTNDLHHQARFVEARDRVDNSVKVGKGEVVEIPEADHPRERGAVLHAEIPKLLNTIALVNEQVIRLNHDGIHHEAEALMEEKSGAMTFGAGLLVELQNALMLANGMLTMTDGELHEHLSSLDGTGFFHHVANYTELLGAIVEVSGGAVGVTAAYGAVVAKLAGDQVLVSSATGLARATGLAFGTVIAGIEIIHGIFVLFDPHASAEEKLDGGVAASSGAAWLIGKRVGGVALGFAASLAILAGYAELKWVTSSYWNASLGIEAGVMRLAFERIELDGDGIALMADKLSKAGILRANEPDPEKAAALARFEVVVAQQLGALVDSFLDDCEPVGFEPGAARYPGGYAILREAFAPVMKYRGATTPDKATEAAKIALDRITWSLLHANELILATAKDEHLGDLPDEVAGEGRKQEQ